MSDSNKNKTTRWWVSWVQVSNDYRPLGYPPHECIMGWWCSGYDSRDNAILVALVEAEDEEAVEAVITGEWPEWEGWRFIEPRGKDYLPGDRFELSEWMQERVNRAL